MSMPAAEKATTATRATWRGIGLTVEHCTSWSRDPQIDHIEVRSDGDASLPITGTGYKSLFILPERIAEYGTPVDYVMAWLDHEAESDAWKRAQDQSRQLSLF